MWSKLLMTSDFTGGGRFGPKTNVHTKEDADHSLPYLLAVALLGRFSRAWREARRFANQAVVAFRTPWSRQRRLTAGGSG
jgi:hypothetical protein